MFRSAISCGLLSTALALSACAASPEEAEKAKVEVKVLDFQGRAVKCIKPEDIGLMPGTGELLGEYRQKFLTPDALKAGIRVFHEGSQTSTFGSQTIYYMDRDRSCVLWMEGLSLQEMAQRLGMDPTLVSPHYVVEKAPVPAPSPSPSPNPSPAK